MSNTSANGNLSHEDPATEATDLLSDENRLNETNNVDVPDVVSTNPIEGNNDSQNEENQVTERATDWSFLNGAGKKRKYGFKVRFVLKLVCCDHETPNGYLVKLWVRVTNEQDKSTVNRDAKGQPIASALHASVPTKKSRLEVVFRVAFHISCFFL